MGVASEEILMKFNQSMCVAQHTLHYIRYTCIQFSEASVVFTEGIHKDNTYTYGLKNCMLAKIAPHTFYQLSDILILKCSNVRYM